MMRWLVALALSVSLLGISAGARGAEKSEEPAPAAGASLKTGEFFSLNSRSGYTRVEREFVGVVVQDLTLVSLRTRNDLRDYRLLLRVRNSGRLPTAPSLRVVLWDDQKPVSAFDIRGNEQGVMLPPRTITRFAADFKLEKDAALRRFTLVPLPPRTPVLRADQPVAVAPEGAKPAGGEPQMTPAQQQEMARFQAEIQRLYAPQVAIPNVNGNGQFLGIGPYGPTYGVPNGGMFIPGPDGWVPIQSMPQIINPNDLSISVSPF